MKQLQTYFTSGLLFLIPLWILYVLVKGIAGLVTGLVQIHVLIAFIISVCGITVFGFLLRRVFKRYIKKHISRWGSRSNLWGFICRAIGQFDDLSDKARKAFDNPILYKVDDGIYKLGFITDHDIDILGSTDHQEQQEANPAADAVWVYAPYPITMMGELILVERRKIKHLDQQELDSLPLFILSAGLIEKTS